MTTPYSPSEVRKMILHAARAEATAFAGWLNTAQPLIVEGGF